MVKNAQGISTKVSSWSWNCEGHTRDISKSQQLEVELSRIHKGSQSKSAAVGGIVKDTQGISVKVSSWRWNCEGCRRDMSKSQQLEMELRRVHKGYK